MPTPMTSIHFYVQLSAHDSFLKNQKMCERRRRAEHYNLWGPQISLPDVNSCTKYSERNASSVEHENYSNCPNISS